MVDIDWDAPIDHDKYFLPPRMCTLYGTDIWEQMTREQQIELSKQELVNLLSMGIWFENLLNRLLLRELLPPIPRRAIRSTRSPRWATSAATW